MTRYEGWEARLPGLVASARRWEYRLGHTDCIAFACAAIREMTGTDLWPRWAGRYDDLRGALVVMAEEADHEQPILTTAISRVLERMPVPPAQLQRGDLAEWDEPDGPHLGVVTGVQVAGFGPKGIYFVPLLECIHGWRVG